MILYIISTMMFYALIVVIILLGISVLTDILKLFYKGD